MDKKYKILLLLLIGLVILYLIWRIFLRRNNPKGNSSLGDVFFGLEKYETPKEYQLLHNLAKNSIPEPLDLGIKEYKREPVPKKLYRTWCTSDPEGICGGRKADIDALNSTRKAIPDWEQIIYGDKEIDNFLEKEFGKDHKVTKAYNLINPKYGAARADLFRYLIIYKYGGFYLDMKSCVSGPIPEMPTDKDMWISEWIGQGANQHLFPETGEYQNWYIYARKGCPLLKEIIERVVHNIYKLHENPNNIINISESLFKNLGGAETKSKGNVLCTTGPIAMTIAILNSNQINNVQVDTSINNVLDYYCIKDDFLGTKDHYAQQTEPLIFPKKDTNHIPKVVYMTYHDIDSVPQYVFDNINKYCSGYEVKIYNDNMCLEFLEKYYGKEAVEIFNNMEIGAHKADFWRYCILYVFGGYYFDIKTDFQTHINNIFDSKKEKTWYTVKAGDAIFNGIIITPPHNPVILDAIKHIYNNPKPTEYHTYVRELLNIVTKSCKNKVKIGENEQKNDWQCILFQENCDSNCVNNCDRYGLNCIIVDKDGKKLFNTRYKDFGSWGKQKVENYVHSQKTYISMTTIPERLKDDWFLNNLKRTIGLLENNQILIINIPKVSLKGEQYIIPDVMNTIQGKNFIIHHCEKDEGPITKLLPSLRNKEIKDDDIIIICDDDIVFREDVFKLLEKSVVDTKNSFASMCTPGPQGYKGFAFIKKTLKPLLNVKIPESCQRLDDDVIEWYMNKNNMHNIVVSYKGNNDWHCSMYKEETDTHPKWSELVSDDREPMTKKCLKDLNNIQEDYTLVYDLENTENPYNTGSKLLWPNNDEEFLKNNWPNTFDFDKEIKEDIINRGRELPLNSAIIDCGAHIGDGAIPIAGALKSIGREDIIVYAIDPGLEKTEFITEMRDKNHLSNLRIINCGLSDKNIVYNHIKRNEKDHWGHNTGGTEWVDSQSEKADINSEVIEFKKLDDLVALGTIPEKIGYIHLDVEGMEDKAILGGLKSIMKYKPILSLEELNIECRKLKDILEPLGYKYIKRIGANNIYEYTKEDYSPGNIYGGKLPNCFITEHVEEGERIVADNYTNPNACVLEFGGGSGAVSTIIQSKLNNPSNHVVIQPLDNENNSEKSMYGGITSLEKNRKSCNSKYHIINHILAKGEGKELLKLVTKPFDTLVVDCENCLVGEYEKNPELFDHIKMIQVERDDFDNSYDSLFSNLNFTLKHSGLGCDGRCATEVWIKNKEEYSPVHITIFTVYISDNITSNKRLSALKNNINKYENITLNVIEKKQEILSTLIEKNRASNENVIDMLNKALNTNCEYIIITEDDFYPIDNFYNELIHTVRLLPKNWRTLHLCPGPLWGRKFGEPDEPGKLRWECGTEPNIPHHKSKRFYINGEDNLFLQHEAWMGAPMCFLIQQQNIFNFMKEYKTHNFDDACDVILTKMLSSNDFICRDPLLGYEKTQGLSIFDENLNNIKEDYSPSRAQFGQDLWALEYHNHKRDGTYLEIGVHDGENANNTVMMDQEYGWRGVCIDPFMDNMEDRSCQKFYVALGSEPGEADFRYGDNGEHSGLAGLDKFATTDDNKMYKDKVGDFEMKKVQVRTPEDVFTEANLPSTIDYMSLDVEGAEMDILRSFPFDKYCVKYATIETNNDKEKEKEMEEFMTQRGYKFEGHKEVDHIFSNTC